MYKRQVEGIAEAVLGASTLTTGSHLLGLRFQDSEGRWGTNVLLDVRVVEATNLTVDSPLLTGSGGVALRTLTGAELTIDGGAALPLAAGDGAFDDVAETIANALVTAGSLAVGNHRLALRFADSEGQWGNAEALDLKVTDAAMLASDPPLLGADGGLVTLCTLAAAEFFVDADPGAGSGIALLAADSGSSSSKQR